MKSSFQKAYGRNVKPDGTIELTFRSMRWPSILPNVDFIKFMLVFWGLVGVSYYLLGTVAEALRLGSGGELLMLALIPGAALTVWVVLILGRPKEILLIKPGEGVVFQGNNLPFTDIQVVGTEYHSGIDNETRYVYAESYGQKIQMTHWMAPELAEQIEREIWDGRSRK